MPWLLCRTPHGVGASCSPTSLRIWMRRGSASARDMRANSRSVRGGMREGGIVGGYRPWEMDLQQASSSSKHHTYMGTRRQKCRWSRTFANEVIAQLTPVSVWVNRVGAVTPVFAGNVSGHDKRS